VDLSGQLSNLSPALLRMLDGKKSQVSRGSAAPTGRQVPQKQVRLSAAQQAELVQRHRDGAFKRELARAYGIHVETVRAIVKRHGLPSGS
jgi:DNA-directed RNA polymerase specialized sigma24 family protein